MRIAGEPWRTIWPNEDGSVGILDQTLLPHRVARHRLRKLDDAIEAITEIGRKSGPIRA